MDIALSVNAFFPSVEKEVFFNKIPPSLEILTLIIFPLHGLYKLFGQPPHVLAVIHFHPSFPYYRICIYNTYVAKS